MVTDELLTGSSSVSGNRRGANLIPTRCQGTGIASPSHRRRVMETWNRSGTHDLVGALEHYLVGGWWI